MYKKSFFLLAWIALFVTANSLPALAFFLPDTGQTQCYDFDGVIDCPAPGQPFYGQDACYIGIESAYQEHGNGTITDLVTGLMWQQSDDGVKRTWQEAPGYCEDLFFGGYDDWRLPDPHELESLIHAGQSNPAIDTDIFDCHSSYYWSNRTSVYSGSYVWNVYFRDGQVRFYGIDQNYYVRCVRGETSRANDDSVGFGFSSGFGADADRYVYSDNGDATISDTDTGLMWQQADDGQPYIWQAALAHCEDLIMAGYQDWRLPNKRELLSIVDYYRSNPAISSAFSCSPGGYWSATTYGNVFSHAWNVSFAYGDAVIESKAGMYPARCVRGGEVMTLDEHALRVFKTGSGGGRVTSQAEGIDCGLDCRQGYAQNTRVNLTATAEFGSVFSGWSGGACAGSQTTCSLTIDRDTDVTAEFTLIPKPKAVIVAGSGPYEGNSLWEATQVCTAYAYRALYEQGIDKDRIFFLSSNADQDLDGNGLFDDVAGDATGANLQYALEDWAADAGDAVVFLTGHGGLQTFRIGSLETLTADDLNQWLSRLQQQIQGQVVVLYDACNSGSFIQALAAPKRAVIASTTDDRPAYFAAEGVLSFSYAFWSQLYLGANFYDALVNAQTAITDTFPGQLAQMDADGNGVANEKQDRMLLADIHIGNEITPAADAPLIGAVCPPQRIGQNETEAEIWARDVADSDGIARVWAVVFGPELALQPVDQPVVDQPIVPLPAVGDGRYAGVYRNFTQPGDYRIAIFAQDSSPEGLTSAPRVTVVTKGADSVDRLPVYRFFSTLNQTHFFTIDEAERDTIIANYPWYLYENVAYDVMAADNSFEQISPVYRFFNTRNGSHFFTIDEAEKDDIIAGYDWYRFEGIAWHAYASAFDAPADALPVYRFFNTQNGSHFFTINEQEKNTIIDKYNWYRFEGPAWYAFAAD